MKLLSVGLQHGVLVNLRCEGKGRAGGFEGEERGGARGSCEEEIFESVLIFQAFAHRAFSSGLLF